MNGRQELKWRHRLVELAAGIIIPLLFLMAVRIQYLCPDGESDVDSFYHAALAEFGPELFTAREFPYTTMSVWHENFSDKELGFHFLLWGIFRAGDLLGWDNAPPFHGSSFLLCALLLGAFAGFLLHAKVRGVWRWTLLFAALSPQLAERLLALRPHLLAMTLFILCVWGFSIPALMKGKRKWIVFFAAGLLFGYCYSNPHFVLMPAGAWMLATLWFERDWRALAAPMTVLAGVAVALVLHPQFPNSFLIWKIQGVDVIAGMLRSNPVLRGGSELTSSGWDTLKGAPLLWLTPLYCGWLWMMRNKAALKWNRESLFLGVLAAGTGIGLCLYFRMVEYGVFAIVAFLAVLARPLERRNNRLKYAGAVVAIAACLWSGVYFMQAPKETYRPCWELAEWVKEKKIPPGTVIGHLSWGDFPQLFYAMPEYRFLCGLDPMFASGRYREGMLMLEDLRRGIRFIPPDELQQATGSRWLWVSRVGEIAAQRLYLYGYVPVFESRDGWLFKLDEPLHAGKPEGVPRLGDTEQP